MYIRVRVTPNARKERVTRVSPTEFQIAVREPALQNRANTRIKEILALELGIEPAQVRLLTGHRSSTKMYSVGG